MKKKMNPYKICFILCVNKQNYFDEALYYINRLHVPDGYSIECFSVTDALSMASGYNQAMNASDAKYKIYLHQDVFIVEQDFLYLMLDIFSNPDVGMLGIVGSPKMPSNGIMWFDNEVGSYCSSNINESSLHIQNTYTEKSCYVDAVDGMLMATQYDLPWREDLFDGWDFYDASQSFEFRKKGYKIAVPLSNKPLVIHDDGLLNLREYFRYRKIFLDEYM